MKVLAIDTSQGTSVAVLADSEVLASVDYAENMTHAERIGQAIADVLIKASVSPKDIDRVVVGLGPGPFTGLRVGIAAAKFFAMGVNAELVGLCSLDAIAVSFYETNEDAGNLLVTTDARRKELFWATYSSPVNGIPVRLSGPSVNKPEDINTSGYLGTELGVSASALGKLAFALGDEVNTKIEPIYLREPDATPSKGKKVSG